MSVIDLKIVGAGLADNVSGKQITHQQNLPPIFVTQPQSIYTRIMTHLINSMGRKCFAPSQNFW
ncbi:hypothetical protein [Floridanema aerugineum]|jgi:hypothetical protein|uniref:Uncharacterized protein n=1 Tax=Floridaenema aerugineum BLCC-F46 TaxID=3153654 RepID=A0ABV4X3T6_9CYAN